MKKLFYLLLALPMLMVACEPEPTPEAKPELTLTSDATLNFTAEGGEGTITYTLKNAVEGVEVEATCEDVWVSDITVADDITFVVAANDGDTRNTKVVVKYDTLSFEVAVEQEAKGSEPNPEPEYTMDVKLAAATRIPSAELDLEENVFALMFVDGAENIELGFILTGAEGDTVLKAGEYEAEEGEMYTYEPEAEYTFVSGDVAVEVEDVFYTFDITLKDADDKLYHFTYEGVVMDMETQGSQVENFNPVKVVACRQEYWDLGNFEVDLYINDVYYHSVDMMDLTNPNENYLSEGFYSMDNGGVTAWSNMVANVDTGEGAFMVAAEITITHNDDGTTNIKGFIESEYGAHLNIDWTGVVEGFSFDNGGGTTPEPNDVFVATTIGGCQFYNYDNSYNFFFFLSDGAEDDYDYGAHPGKTFWYIDLYAMTDGGEGHVIPNGTYTYDPKNTSAAGTVGGGYTFAVIVDETGNPEWRYFDSGTVVVTDGKIEATLANKDGSYSLVYEGDLAFGVTDNTLSDLTGDIEFNETGLTLFAEYYGQHYTDDTDNWFFTLIEDAENFSGKCFMLDILADYYADDYSGKYTPLTDDSASYVYKFHPGNLSDLYTTGCWYYELENGDIAGNSAPLVDGTIEIIINADQTRTFVLDCVDDAGNKITGSITATPYTKASALSASTPCAKIKLPISKKAAR